MFNKKLVIFDMGNTLLNFHDGLHTDAEKDQLGIENMSAFLLTHYGCSIPPEVLKQDFLDKWYADFYLRKTQGELDVKQYLMPVLSAYEIDMDTNGYIALMAEFYKVYMEEVLLSKGAVDLLKQLHEKGIKIAVASNCILFDELYIKTFEAQDIRKYIDKFVFSYSRGYRKPDLRIFEEIAQHFGFPNHEILMVGDSLEADIAPAKQLGFETIWLNRKNEVASAAVDIEVSNFEELAANL